MPLYTDNRVQELQQEIDKATVAGGAQDTAVLTPRQQEVLRLLAQGFTAKETGRALNITARTVAFHKYRIMANCGLANNSDLIRLAIRRQLILALSPSHPCTASSCSSNHYRSPRP
ncbi:MAG: hypothetical protein C5B58_09120 [Acidobacteria bacterium]|nr:MAG: hypothetical protein C5B58_09120 [Acidobacteriota bacterium]